MALYIISHSFELDNGKGGDTTIFSLLNFISWTSLLKYIRRLNGVRGFISLVFNAIAAMMNFLVIVILFMVAFATSIW